MEIFDTKETMSHWIRADNADTLTDENNAIESLHETAKQRETILLLAKMMVTIFVCEAAIMAILAVLPLGDGWSILADPVLLTLMGAPILYLLIVRPIKHSLEERKKDKKKLLIYQKQLRSLASKLTLTEERERHHLATELHDEIGQSLVFAKLKLDQLRQTELSEDVVEALEDASDYLDNLIQKSQKLTFDLSSPILYELGFEAAVGELLEDEIKTKHGIEIEFRDDGQQKPLSDDIRSLLFRCIRELLVNIVKHAQANTVKISICRINGEIQVTVEDDGVGFDPFEVSNRSTWKAEFGLFGISERLEQLDGHININSEPGRGCRILMTVPLEDKCKEKSNTFDRPVNFPAGNQH